jgi:hypothetical protein
LHALANDRVRLCARHFRRDCFGDILSPAIPPPAERLAAEFLAVQHSDGKTRGCSGSINSAVTDVASDQTITARQPRRDRALGDEQVGIVVILPRLARALHQPAVAVVLGVILVVVGVIGLATHDIAKGFSILIIVVGTINVGRALPHNDQGHSS